MSFTVETLENNTAKFTITVDAAKFEYAIKKAYEKSAFNEEFLLKKGKKSFCKVTL